MLATTTKELLKDCIFDACGREICAYLLVDEQGIEEIYRTTNMASDPGSFFICGAEFRRMERYAQREKLKVRAFIHSHVHSLDLSESDVIGLRESGLPWIVVVLAPDGLDFKVHHP
jgi:proteasome lid subunit RPN8/RPN11